MHGVVVGDLGRRIVHGEIATGAQLPVEEVGEQYGVSRPVVRETMRVLESKGLVVARQNVGTRVRDPKSWHGLDIDVLRWRLSGPDAADARAEILELRAALEPTVARLAALNSSGRSDEPLARAIAQMQAAFEVGDVEAFTAADVCFHAAVFEAAGNPLLTSLFALVSATLDDRIETITSHGISPRAVDVHVRLAASLAAGDVEGAEITMSELVALSGQSAN